MRCQLLSIVVAILAISMVATPAYRYAAACDCEDYDTSDAVEYWYYFVCAKECRVSTFDSEVNTLLQEDWWSASSEVAALSDEIVYAQQDINDSGEESSFTQEQVDCAIAAYNQAIDELANSTADVDAIPSLLDTAWEFIGLAWDEIILYDGTASTDNHKREAGKRAAIAHWKVDEANLHAAQARPHLDACFNHLNDAWECLYW